ncbi:hypothetical protein DPMN_070347 [Dreissena polymorpha]|uniref:Uncharacterized protein n=1 Tax=Dreissena polymorpha TaxID=45954 RepID=A0A9D4BVK4_DREPO|nr:hypothetical protein DPMN_070347 [Dreissena polymorpha]
MTGKSDQTKFPDFSLTGKSESFSRFSLISRLAGNPADRINTTKLLQYPSSLHWSPWRSAYGVRRAIRRLRVQTPMGALLLSPTKTPSTGYSPMTRTREHFNKPKAFYAI